MDIIKETKLIKENYEGGTVEIIDGLSYSQYQVLKQIEFYTNSRYLESKYEYGNRDEYNRLKPFYNIINFRVGLATRATDFDTKDFDVYSESPKHYIKSMMFGKEMKNWMKRTNFAQVLNDFCYTRAKYGGVMIKRIMRNGELRIEIPEWKNLITDQVDIRDGVKAEKHYMTPVQLQTKEDSWDYLSDNWDLVEKTFKKLYGKSYSTADRICVLEVEGEFPDSYLKDTEVESDKYCLQRHIILLSEEEVPIACLHSEEKKESDYRYLEWMKASGRGLGIGVAEDGFEAQIATNDSILKEKDIMEIASRTVFWTDSETIENNIINDLEVGDILKVKQGEQMSTLNTTPSSLPQLDNIREKWDDQYTRATSTYEAMTGETMPSGTPFRSVAIQNQESVAMFAYRMEEAGIFWREVFSDWIVSHLKKKLTRKHILTSDFSTEELQVIDGALSTERANRIVIDHALEGRVTNAEEYTSLLEAEMQLLSTQKNTRYLDIPDGYFKDLEAEIDVNITGEQLNKGAMFESINNLIVTVANSFQPETGTFAVLEDPVLSKLFERAVEMANVGISPAEIIFNRGTQARLPQGMQSEPLEEEEEPVTA